MPWDCSMGTIDGAVLMESSLVLHVVEASSGKSLW